MTLAVNYGNILSHQTESLFEGGNSSETYSQFFLETMKPRLDAVKELQRVLAKQARKAKANGRQIKLLTLNEERYGTMINNLLEKKEGFEIEVLPIDENIEDNFDINYHIKSYLYKASTVEERKLPIKKAREKLIEYLKQSNKGNLKHLEESGVNVNRVTNIPFQFIASIPKEQQNTQSDYNGKCLVIFTNLYGSSNIESTTCFYSTNDRLIKDFYEIFNDKIAQNSSNKKKQDNFTSVFGTTDLEKTCFVMHESELKYLPEAEEKTITVRFRDDVIAETKIKELFKSLYRDKFIENNPKFEDEFLSDRIHFDILKDPNRQTIITIGLFENKLTEKVIKNSDSFLKLEKIPAKELLAKDKESGKWIAFKSELSIDTEGIAKGHDYGIFAKLKYEDKTVIICGGYESFGTRRIGDHIAKNWDKIFEEQEKLTPGLKKEEIANKEFVCIYKFDTDTAQTVTLVHYYSV
jgi:hypothetical protein